MGSGSKVDDGEALRTRIADFIKAVDPSAANPVVSQVHRSDIGYSRENWTFDAEWSVDGWVIRRSLIMRRDPTGSVLATDRNGQRSAPAILGRHL